MIAAVTSSKSARWDHRALRVKSRVVGINISGRARTGASAASRARMRWENQRAEPNLAADHIKYLQPEPLLQEPRYLRVEAGEGRSVSTYSYARSNPLTSFDSNGLKPASVEDLCPEAYGTPGLEHNGKAVYEYDDEQSDEAICRRAQEIADRACDPGPQGGGPKEFKQCPCFRRIEKQLCRNETPLVCKPSAPNPTGGG